MAGSASPGGGIAPARHVVNTVAGVVHGTVAQIGVVHGNVYVGTRHAPPSTAAPGRVAPPPRTGHLDRARAVAPRELLGREAELAELEDFCTSPRPAAPYQWWTAPAWGGKSALTAWFATHPPAGVRVVSFFGAPESTGRNARMAFVDEVTDQLAALLGRSASGVTSRSAREARLPDLLAEAADECAEHGEHLVLVVDGAADPDRVPSSLPARPPGNLRVVVTGRAPGPAPRCARVLPPSGVAREARAGAEDDLATLVDGAGDLVGLLAVCRGGLAVDDLAELCGTPSREVAGLLGAADRCLVRRAPLHPGAAAADVYSFRHRDLREAACGLFAPSELDRYRRRVHAWARRYRARGWPPDTPEYLLRGYFELVLEERGGRRAVELATSAERRARLLALTGDDRAAVDDLCCAMSRLREEDSPDLVALVRLAVHRDRLAAVRDVPVPLPAAWARLGDVGRAEQLARSIPDADDRTRALTALARTLAEVGDTGRAEEVARSIPGLDDRSAALAVVAEAVAAAGDPAWAETLAGSIPDPHRRTRALALVAVAAAADDPARAESIARRVDDEQARSGAVELIGQAVLERHVGALAEAGDFDLATAVLPTVTNPYRRSRAACAIARHAALAGEAELAAALLARAGEEVVQVRNADERALAVQDLACAAAAAERPSWARSLVEHGVPGRAHRVRALTALARAVAGGGRTGEAAALLDQAEELAWSIPDPGDRAWALVSVVEQARHCGDRTRAGGVIRRSGTPLGVTGTAGELARALTAVAAAAAANGHEDWAHRLRDHVRRRLADAADDPGTGAAGPAPARSRDLRDLHESATDPARRAVAWARLAGAAARTGHRDLYAAGIEHAVDLSCSIEDPYREALALADLARVAGAAADDERADGLLDRAEAAASAVPHLDQRSDAIATTAQAAADTGRFDRSEVLARSVTDSRTRARALTHLARCATERGDVGWASSLAGSIPEAGHRAWALSAVAEATARLGEPEWAVELTGAVDHPAARSAALTAIVPALPRHRRAHVIGEVLEIDEWHRPLGPLFAARPDATPVVVRELALAYCGRPTLGAPVDGDRPGVRARSAAGRRGGSSGHAALTRSDARA
ncbi:hypothetical protein [Saccharothrix syringae]|uniref:Uncharacterized protein n=1 Tax=Saccharothrix syringae TaxID=103733 RepID=A0A5Q0H2F4_SACSY|nr:hypothetical protein [Saccharothrix syringae]QFZ20000.1 hypothetical protein EKG83_23540 [Saccharothrix syringae]